jgi:hypothetical protein
MSPMSVPCRSSTYSTDAPTSTSGPTSTLNGVHLTKGERRMMHSLLDREEGEARLVASKHAEEVVERLITLGFIEVKVTEAGRTFMDAT